VKSCILSIFASYLKLFHVGVLDDIIFESYLLRYVMNRPSKIRPHNSVTAFLLQSSSYLNDVFPDWVAPHNARDQLKDQTISYLDTQFLMMRTQYKQLLHFCVLDDIIFAAYLNFVTSLQTC